MMSGYSAKPSSLSFDHSGVLLATGGGERVTVWSLMATAQKEPYLESWNFIVSPLLASRSHHVECV